MKLSKEHIAKCAKDVLAFLDNKKIRSLEDIEKIPYVVHPVADRALVLVREAQYMESTAWTISFLPRENTGFPAVEFRIYLQEKRSVILFKGYFHLCGYELFERDSFENSVQYKEIKSISLAAVRSELEKLAE